MRKYLLLPLLLLATGLDAAPITLGPRHKDESNGFQIQLPSKWQQVPTKFKEVVVIGKWAAKRPKRGRISPELRVLRFVKPKGAGEGETPGDVLRRGVPGSSGMIRFQPKDVWDYVKKMTWAKLEVVEDDPDFKMSRSRTHKAHYRVYRQKGAGGSRDAAKSQLLVVAASIETRENSDATYGVVFVATVADERDALHPFKLAVKRFRILEEDDEEEAEDSTDADIFVDSSKKPAAWRNARKKKLSSVKGWAALDTENYLIVYNKQVKRSLLKKIAKHIEAIRAQVYTKLFPPTREIKAVSVVRVCKDLAEYHRYGGPPGSAGYWSPGDEELVVPGGMNKDTLRVLYHEAFHQYIHYAVGKVAPHSWFNEGHGDYFSGHNYSARKFKPAPFKWRTGIIANALSTGNYVKPLSKFLKYTQREYYSSAGLCYAQGWSFVYFLREVERRKIKRYKKYWGLLDRYFEAIKRNVKGVQENAFEGLEPDRPGKEGEGEQGEEEGEKQPKEEPFEEPVEPQAPPGPARLPGLEKPFPGEHPAAGAGEDPEAKAREGETRSVAGPKITGVKSALDAAVDEAFGRIDMAQLEKDWVAWSK